MKKRFYEMRQLVKPVDRIAVDLARHLQARQHLGTAIVVCDKPHALMSAVRKQWLRLSRNVQRLRASTLNAEEILRHTRAIMQMQNMQFVVKTPAEEPDATVYFVTPQEMNVLPDECYTFYIATPLQGIPVTELPANSLIVSYCGIDDETLKDVLPKQELEVSVLDKWQPIAQLLEARGVEPLQLSLQEQQILDKTLDAIIDDSETFIEYAFAFQRALDLAQPLVTISGQYQYAFEAVSRLAYRVGMLTPHRRVPQFASAFADNDNYFLRDSGALSNDDDWCMAVCEGFKYTPLVSATIKP